MTGAAGAAGAGPAGRSGVGQPVILAVDDEPEVLRAVTDDLRARYADRYRVLRASSGEQALEMLDELRLRARPVALLLVDQRMPGLSGTELLERAAALVPDARTVLLTAYADVQAAIDAINRVRLDHYVTKPWHPPSERLYPVLDELLEAWQATAGRPLTGTRLVGDRWSAASHRLRDFLARNHVPFRWLEIGASPEAAELLAAAPSDALPLLVLEDGRVLAAPALPEVAAAIGLTPDAGTDFVDVVIVGAGPAGLAAAVYATSEGLSAALVEAQAPGGQAALSSRIENYLGFPAGISGAELTRRATTQARRFGARVVSPRTVVRLHRDDPYRIVEFDDGATLRCSCVVVAGGVQYRTLDVPGAERLAGRGVYYGAASTEAAAMAGEPVLVVGGANSAGQAAVHLAGFADRVTLLVRAGSLGARMSSYLVEQVGALPNVEVRTRTEVVEVHGAERLEAVSVKDGGVERLPAAGMFVFTGAHPRTDWLATVVARDPHGFVLTGPSLRPAGRWALDRDPYLLETSLPGVFAVGDVRAASVKRVASAVGEGSVAVQFVHAYLRA
ncbi:MAG: FAD-dependent oxidoreductase [Pseudonocardia sp.]